MTPLAPHVHDTSSPRGSCGTCYRWSLLALREVMTDRKVNVVAAPAAPSNHWSTRKAGSR